MTLQLFDQTCNAKSPIKTIEYPDKKTDAIIYVVNRDHLHTMRSMIGAIKYVGEGKWNIDDLRSN